MESMKAWVKENKLKCIGLFWASVLGASFVYSRRKVHLKPSLRLIHARMYAQAMTLAVLSGAAVMHHYEEYAKHAKDDDNSDTSNPMMIPALSDDVDLEADRWSW